MTEPQVSPSFHINSITVHNVEGASCVNLGINEPRGFTNHKKHNQGFGTVSGDGNTIDGIKTLLHDEKLMDLFASSGITNQEAIEDFITSKVREYLSVEEEDQRDRYTGPINPP